MTNAEAWEAYMNNRTIRVAPKWKREEEEGGIVGHSGGGMRAAWFYVVFRSGHGAWYGAEQLREVEA